MRVTINTKDIEEKPNKIKYDSDDEYEFYERQYEDADFTEYNDFDLAG